MYAYAKCMTCMCVSVYVLRRNGQNWEMRTKVIFKEQIWNTREYSNFFKFDSFEIILWIII